MLLDHTDNPDACAGAIKDVSQADFAQEVLSADVPVVVDFWAPWCEPCKALTPILEEAVRKAGGRVRLAKVNVDESPELATQLRIQSLPTVIAFVRGRPVDGFNGQVTATQVRDFIAKFIKAAGGDDQAQDLIAQARQLLAGGDPMQAGLLCEQVLQKQPEYPPAIALYLRCLIGKGEAGIARRELTGLPQELAKKPEIASVAHFLTLMERATVCAQDIDHLEQDPAAWQNLATAYLIAGRHGDGFALLLGKLKDPDSTPEDKDLAKAQLLDDFQALDADDPDVLAARKSLSRMLFS
ncbi:MAG: thioredoxin [Pseudomonadota bacterium]